MRKRYKDLTEDQKQRDVIFSSTLLPSDSPTVHEVFKGQEDGSEVITRLKDDKFFNNSPYKYNETFDIDALVN